MINSLIFYKKMKNNIKDDNLKDLQKMLEKYLKKQSAITF